MPKVAAAAASASTAASFGKAAPGAKLQLTAAATPKGQPMSKPFFVQTGPVFGIH